MTNLCCEVLKALEGKTLVTAESLTGGGIGGALTAVPGSSAVYKGGIICYTNWVKQNLLGVPEQTLGAFGAVSAQTALAMAQGARERLEADVALAVTGLAGPGGDELGHPVGTVFIACAWDQGTVVRELHFQGTREDVRQQTITQGLTMVLGIFSENPPLGA